MYYNRIPEHEKELHTLDMECTCSPIAEVCEKGFFLVTHNEFCPKGLQEQQRYTEVVNKEEPMKVNRHYYIAMAILVVCIASIAYAVFRIVSGPSLDARFFIYALAFFFLLGVYFASWFLSNK